MSQLRVRKNGQFVLKEFGSFRSTRAANLKDCLRFLESHNFQGATDIYSWINFRVKWLKNYIKNIILKKQKLHALPQNGDVIAGILLVQRTKCSNVTLLLNPDLNLTTLRKTQCKLTSQNLRDFGHNILDWPVYSAINGVTFNLWAALITLDWQFREHSPTEIFAIDCIGKLHGDRILKQINVD